ncbi:MAG: AAA family ATPase [Nostoc sp. ChiSLP02]|nr:AAA family ATPase [Nostoc sp. DedSLP05]MDZ8098819.1 AAA family ATPase [Nostoc sp. DedSLP01]MDZ8183567.1 AAA family ATPase [Nostoc sp. ChiSLP02]
MVVNLPGYLLNECLHEGIDTAIYRARRESDFSTVIIKTINAEYPTLEEITRLRHEYTILEVLADIKGIAKVKSLEHYGHSSAIILEDFWGISFQKLLTLGKLPVLSFLPLAIQLAEILHNVHKNHIIHKDINPQNILLDPDSLTVKLIDFSIASRLSKENPCINNPEKLEGTLAYISPEQTARMNRSVDYRTDFYSLGVTFYEMLTGQLPFTTIDPLELVHCHIAKNPRLPHEVSPEIPKAVSDIVLKLMAKTAEDRYQNALGLKADLETCLYQLQSQGEITEFALGDLDRSGQFLIPQKLYGRTREVRSLLQAFERVSAGTTEMMLVSGYSGIGKTSVINEIHKPILQQRGYFISGKFDQFKKNIPYAALIQAFQALIQQILTQSPEKIATWKQNLLTALGANAQVIIDVIPEVEHIIGSQPPIPELGATEFQNRLDRVFQQFFDVFAKVEHPLVLFLDDLQWADAPSLKLIENVICNKDSKYLLLIGAYRDNEVSPTHPTIVTIERIYSRKDVVHNIVLQPLNFDNICELINDTFNKTLTPQSFYVQENNREKVRNLAELIYNKTQGNPFFLTQMLQTLYAEGLLHFNFSLKQWQWEILQIQALGITDYSVVELVARNLQKLPDATQQVLKLGACMGHEFTLENLAVVYKKSLQETANALWEALQAGLILPLSQAYKIPMFVERSEQEHCQVDNVKIAYKFLHDRVQQAAYSLIPDDDKQKTHLSIGRLLLHKTPDSALEENIFDIVNQLNIGLELITQPTDKEHLASLNLIAGSKAKQATAYEAAVKYLNIGLGLLPKTAWSSNYELALNLYTTMVEAEYLNTNYERAEQLSNIVLAKAKKPLEKIKVYETKIQVYVAQNQMLEAIDTALEALKILGISLPKAPSKCAVNSSSLVTKIVVAAKGIDNLAQLPEMTDPYKIAAMRILISVLIPAYLTTPNLFPLVTFKMVNLSVRYGNSPQAAYGYALYGWLLCGAFGDIKSGYEFGQLAMKLLERFENSELKCKVVNIFNAFVRHWKEHARETIPAFVDALQMSLEAGDIEYAGYSSINYCHYTFLLGEHLDNVNACQKPYIDLMRKLKQEYAIHSISTVRQTEANLLGESANPCRLIGDSFNEQEMLPVFEAANVMTSLFMTYFYKAMLLYLFKEYDQSVEKAELAQRYTANILGFITLAAHNFYYSLALLASYPKQQNAKAKNQLLQKVEINQQKMRNWAEQAPENYRHKYELVEAEKARVLGNHTQAIAHYKEAIEAAAKSGYIQEEALANELVAEFYFASNQEALAEVYLIKSYYAYIRWGAKAKVKDLELRYPEFFCRILQRENINRDISHTIVTAKSTIQTAALDVAAIAKALQAIAFERSFDKLLAQLMLITVEYAGASKGVLLLSKAGQLEPVAVSDRQDFPINNQLQLITSKSTSLEHEVRLLSSLTIAESLPELPISVINYVERTQKTIVLNNARVEGIFINDPYILKTQPKSVYCCPLIHQGQFIGLLYLENDLSVGVFTNPRLEILQLLVSQAGISLINT